MRERGQIERDCNSFSCVASVGCVNQSVNHHACVHHHTRIGMLARGRGEEVSLVINYNQCAACGGHIMYTSHTYLKHLALLCLTSTARAAGILGKCPIQGNSRQWPPKRQESRKSRNQQDVSIGWQYWRRGGEDDIALPCREMLWLPGHKECRECRSDRQSALRQTAGRSCAASLLLTHSSRAKQPLHH